MQRWRSQHDGTTAENVDLHACDSDEGGEKSPTTNNIFLHGLPSLEYRKNQHQVETETRLSCDPFPHRSAGKGLGSGEQRLDVEMQTARALNGHPGTYSPCTRS